jgi:phage baseplate assembly protein W
MKRQTELERVTPHLGRDLLLDYTFGGGFFEDADFATRVRQGAPVAARDLAVAEGVAAITQAIANRLKTRKGELASLGHPDYGSRHHELIGEPNVERTRDLIKLYVLQALRHEPRIEKVLRADVRAEHARPREVVRIELYVRLLREPSPLNLVIPFSLEATL